VAKVEPPDPPKDPIAEKLAAERPDPAIEQAKKLEEERREEARKAEEQRLADEQKKAEEQKKLAEDEKRRKEAELKKKKEDDEKKRKAAELKKKLDDERKRKEAEAKKQKSFDDQMREMQALLNKVPDKGAPLPNTPQEESSKNKGPVLGAKDGRDQTLTASELAVLKQIIRSCVGPKWFFLGGGADAQNVVVRIRVQFTPEGRLARSPEVLNPQNTPLFNAAAESALRAVQNCEPYPLPPSKYDAWKDTILNLDPKDMY
jgi:colicin import membrane protein